MTKTVLMKRLQLMLTALLVALAVGGGLALDDASAMMLGCAGHGHFDVYIDGVYYDTISCG